MVTFEKGLLGAEFCEELSLCFLVDDEKAKSITERKKIEILPNRGAMRVILDK